MTEPLVPGGRCERCGGRWSGTGTAWLISDRAGRAYLMELTSQQEGRPPSPLTRCPQCGARLRVAAAEQPGNA